MDAILQAKLPAKYNLLLFNTYLYACLICIIYIYICVISIKQLHSMFLSVHGLFFNVEETDHQKRFSGRADPHLSTFGRKGSLLHSDSQRGGPGGPLLHGMWHRKTSAR